MDYLLSYNKYPKQIKSWADNNKPLWYLGNPKILNLPMVSIIGTRSPSSAGTQNAIDVAKNVVSQGFCVVSGMAKGIDTAAHFATLDLNGSTIAVMGTPVKDCYPKENLKLKEKIIKSGLILSQFHPEAKTNRYNFPRRNELMAELSLISIVIEAGPNSGVQHQIRKAVQLKKKIVFFKDLVKKNHKWVSQYLEYENCFVFNNTSEFKDWITREKEYNNIPEDSGEGEDGAINNCSKNHDSAIGYLNDLRNKVNKKWFRLICEMAFNNSDQLDEAKLTQLAQVFLANNLSNDSNVPNKSPNIETDTDGEQSDLFSIRLDCIKNFKNFKSLSTNIQANFETPLAIVFGANGSGKSSLCHAIKKLAGESVDTGISLNVMHPSDEPPSFEYQFSNDSKAKKCTLDSFSPEEEYRDKIKYFDPDVSRNIIINNHDSKKVVSVLAFNLEIFDRLQSHLNQLRNYLEKHLHDKQGNLTTITQKLKSKLTQNGISHMGIYDDVEQGDFNKFKNLIERKIIDKDAETRINEITKELSVISNQRSPAYKTKLNDQLGRLDKILKVLSRLQQAYSQLCSLTPQELQKKYNFLKEKQKEEISYLVPDENKVKEFKEFLKYSQEIVDYGKEGNDHCIFCKQELDDKSIQVIKAYQQFLKSDLEQEIKQLESNIQKYNEKRQNIASYDFEAVLLPIPESIKHLEDDLMAKIKYLKEFCQKNLEQVATIKNIHENSTILNSEINIIKESLEKTSQEIKALEQQSKGLANRTENLEIERNKLKLAKEFIKHKNENKYLYENIKEYARIKKEIESENFTALLSNITKTSNQARGHLIVDNFVNNLNQYYKELSEKSLESSGIYLKSVRRDDSGDIKPKIKGKYKLSEILSEGEQKIYSLALFFAELDHEKKPIIVFDDPVSSLDYSYAGNISQKIKNFSKNNSDKQIIIFTHDWYFLKDMQDSLVRSELKENKDFSVYVLNNCNEIYPNEENENKVQQKIECILDSNSHLNKDQEESLSFYMRKLIEVIVNKYVFNNQRTQYKRDKINPGMFYEYTKLKPLHEDEATTLTDLYSRLSPNSHDNPVPEFQKLDKEIFKSRYQQIKEIKTNLKQSNPTRDTVDKLSIDNKLLANEIQHKENLAGENKLDETSKNI